MRGFVFERRPGRLYLDIGPFFCAVAMRQKVSPALAVAWRILGPGEGAPEPESVKPLAEGWWWRAL